MWVDASKLGRRTAHENTQDVILSLVENPHSTVQGLSRDLNTKKSTVSNIFKTGKIPSLPKVLIIHEMIEDDWILSLYDEPRVVQKTLLLRIGERTCLSSWWSNRRYDY